MNASNFVEGVDFSLYFILAISVIFLVGITVVMVYFLFKYSKKRNPVATNIDGNNKLEIIWTVIPTILVLFMFYYGWVGWKPMQKAPDNAMTVSAIGQMWKWSFEYPNGKFSDSLVVPVGKPVKLNLISKDVIHSLFIPAYRIKKDVVPGDTNMMWFVPQTEGSYVIECAEYCGQLHSYMLSYVKVLNQENFDKWLNSNEHSDEHPGLTLMKKNACLSCHTLDGRRLVGPSFKGLWGKTETVITGPLMKKKKVVVNRDYLYTSIREPIKDIVEGYPGNVMTSYDGILNDEEIDQIVRYIKSIK